MAATMAMATMAAAGCSIDGAAGRSTIHACPKPPGKRPSRHRWDEARGEGETTSTPLWAVMEAEAVEAVVVEGVVEVVVVMAAVAVVSHPPTSSNGSRS